MRCFSRRSISWRFSFTSLCLSSIRLYLSVKLDNSNSIVRAYPVVLRCFTLHLRCINSLRIKTWGRKNYLQVRINECRTNNSNSCYRLLGIDTKIHGIGRVQSLHARTKRMFCCKALRRNGGFLHREGHIGSGFLHREGHIRSRLFHRKKHVRNRIFHREEHSTCRIERQAVKERLLELRICYLVQRCASSIVSLF